MLTFSTHRGDEYFRTSQKRQQPLAVSVANAAHRPFAYGWFEEKSTSRFGPYPRGG
jgi:hypothetical protein